MTIKGRAIGATTFRKKISPEKFDPGTHSWTDLIAIQAKQEIGVTANQKTAQMLQRIAEYDIAYLVARYPRGTSADFRTNVVVNPESFSESVEPQYSRRPVLGLSHEVIQYIRTASREISMQFWVSWDVYIQKKLAHHDMHPTDFRNFMQSLCVPVRARLAPPLVEVHWPGANLGFTGVVDSLSIEYTRFSSKGDPIDYTIDVTFVEVARALMVTNPVFFFGMGRRSQLG
jgi:hypothetical protein